MWWFVCNHNSGEADRRILGIFWATSLTYLARDLSQKMGVYLPDEGSESCSWTPVTTYTFTHMHDHCEAVYLVCHSLKFLLETVCWSPWCPDWPLVGTKIWVKNRAMFWSLCDSRTHHTFTLAVWEPVWTSSYIGLAYKKTSLWMTQS